MQVPPLIPEKTLLRAQVGSHAYGTSTPESDTDFMEVVAASDQVYLSLDWFGSQGTMEKKEKDEDGNLLSEETSYELTKFMRLCQNFNPNVIPLLWVSNYEYVDPLGQVLIDNRHLFNSKRAIDSFAGYAFRQLEKMGVDNPATGRMGAKRKAIRDKFGFDTKYMYHAVRLARMIGEFFSCNGAALLVDRRGIDAEELKAIREGAWTYEQGRAEILRLLEASKEAAAASSLPDEPDKQAIRDLARYILRKHLRIDANAA
jgi:predicted nucleotidyltransferase